MIDSNVTKGTQLAFEPVSVPQRGEVGVLEPTTSRAKFTFVDMFAGLGGFHHALGSLGGECVWACDIDPSSKKVYLATWPEMEGKFTEDVRNITTNEDGLTRPSAEIKEKLPNFDVLCAGFPCQPFSLAGKQEGVYDKTRGTLFHDIIAVVKAKNPKVVILENVKNLISVKHKNTWETIIAALQEEGYLVPNKPIVISPHNLPPALGGAPQNRERVFIVAVHKNHAKPEFLEKFNYDKLKAHFVKPNWDINSILMKDPPNKEEYFLRQEELAWVEAWNYLITEAPQDSIPNTLWVENFTENTPSSEIVNNLPGWKKHIMVTNQNFYRTNKELVDIWLKQNWWVSSKGRVERHEHTNKDGTCHMSNGICFGTVKNFPPSRQKLEFQAKSYQPTRDQRNLWTLVTQFRQSGIRVKPPTYLPALVAVNQTSVINSRRRRITPVEAGRLQGLPDSVFPHAKIPDKNAYKLAGNAVNVGVVTFLATQLIPHTNLLEH